jgi:hypothetical protein
MIQNHIDSEIGACDTLFAISGTCSVPTMIGADPCVRTLASRQ